MTDIIEIEDDIGADDWAGDVHCPHRARKRAWLEAKVAEFLARGGEIQQIEIGEITLAGSVPRHPSTFHLTGMTAKARERMDKEAERLDGILRSRPNVTAEEVQQMLCISREKLQRLVCQRFHSDPRAQHLRKYKSLEARWEVKEHRQEILRLYNEAIGLGLDNRRAIAKHMGLHPDQLLKFGRYFRIDLPRGKQGRAPGSRANLTKGRAKKC